MIERLTDIAPDERILSREAAVRIAERVSEVSDILTFRATPSTSALEFSDIEAGAGYHSLLSGTVSFDHHTQQIRGTMTIERPGAPGVCPCHITNDNCMGIWQLGPEQKPCDEDAMAAFLAQNVTPNIERMYRYVRQPDMKPLYLFRSIGAYFPARAQYAEERVTYAHEFPLIEKTDVCDAAVELQRRRCVDEISPAAHSEDAVVLRTRRLLDDGFSLDTVYSLRIGHGFTSLAVFGLSHDDTPIDLSTIPTEYALSQLYYALDTLIDERLD
jgi:hypothetical protein